MLKLSSEVTRFGLLLYTIQTYQVNNSNSVCVKRPSFTPIQLISNIPIFSIILNSLLATILLSNFLMVLSSAIGQQAFAIEQDGFYSFWRTTVIESLNGFGWYLITIQLLKSLASIRASCSPHVLKNQLIIFFKPRALLKASPFKATIIFSFLTSSFTVYN